MDEFRFCPCEAAPSRALLRRVAVFHVFLGLPLNARTFIFLPLLVCSTLTRDRPPVMIPLSELELLALGLAEWPLDLEGGA